MDIEKKYNNILFLPINSSIIKQCYNYCSANDCWKPHPLPPLLAHCRQAKGIKTESLAYISPRWRPESTTPWVNGWIKIFALKGQHKIEQYWLTIFYIALSWRKLTYLLSQGVAPSADGLYLGLVYNGLSARKPAVFIAIYFLAWRLCSWGRWERHSSFPPLIPHSFHYRLTSSFNYKLQTINVY